MGGCRVPFYEVGRGPTALLTMGWAMSGRMYEALADKIAEQGMRVLLPVSPGHRGTKSLSKASPTFATMAEWQWKFLESIGENSRITIVGHSGGGAVALEMANQAPMWVNQLVLIHSAGGPEMKPGVPLTKRSRAAWALGFAQEMNQPGGAKILSEFVRDVIPNVSQNPRLMYQVSELVRTADETIAAKNVVAWQIDTLTFAGDNDQVMLHGASESLAELLEVPLHDVAGSHSTALMKPDEVVGKMAAALEQVLEAERLSQPLRLISTTGLDGLT